MAGDLLQLARALQAGVDDVSPRELAEIAWLHDKIGSRSEVLTQPKPRPDEAPDDEVEAYVQAEAPPAWREAEAPVSEPPGTPAHRASAGATVVRSPTSSRALAWQRLAVRLAPRALHGTPELDLPATVEQAARLEGELLPRWCPTLMPACVLVVLEEPAGQLEPWRPQLEALLDAARRSGRFVAVYHHLLTDPAVRARMLPGQSALVLLVSDGLRQAPSTPALRPWLPRGGVVRLGWINPWGPTLWHRTAVGPLAPARPVPVPSSQDPAAWTAALLPFEPSALQRLEGWVHGRGGRGVRGVSLPRREPRPVPAAPERSWEQRRRELDAVMSAPARVALGLAAAVPGNVDVELLWGLGEALGEGRIRREHVTEALASGFLERVEQGEEGRPRRVVARFRDAEARRQALGWLARPTVHAVLKWLVALTRAPGRDLAHLELPVRLLWRAVDAQGDGGGEETQAVASCTALLDVVRLSRLRVSDEVNAAIEMAAVRRVQLAVGPRVRVADRRVRADLPGRGRLERSHVAPGVLGVDSPGGFPGTRERPRHEVRLATHEHSKAGPMVQPSQLALAHQVRIDDPLVHRVHWRLRHEVIQHTRMACRYTQADLASRLGISVRHLRRIETGSAYGRASGFRIRTPSNLDLLDRLCFELGLEYADLLELVDADN